MRSQINRVIHGRGMDDWGDGIKRRNFAVPKKLDPDTALEKRKKQFRYTCGEIEDRGSRDLQ